MFVTSLKTQASLLFNPLDLSINFTNNLAEVFKSYYVIFKTYDFFSSTKIDSGIMIAISIPIN